LTVSRVSDADMAELRCRAVALMNLIEELVTDQLMHHLQPRSSPATHFDAAYPRVVTRNQRSSADPTP